MMSSVLSSHLPAELRQDEGVGRDGSTIMSVMAFAIGHRLVGPSEPPLVIAEIGINHGGDLVTAIEIAKAAIDAGAEVVKHQTHVIEDEMSLEAGNVVPGNSNESIHTIIQRCALDADDERELMEYVKERGALYISTPFSRLALARLIDFDVPAIKIGSGECNNYPLVELVARAGKPVILSTGMNDLNSIVQSVNILRKYAIPFALLHCTNIYPTEDRDIRLGALGELQDAFPDAIIGLSDHSLSIHPCIAAVALGACVLERHFIDLKTRPGPDIVCSMTPSELSELIDGSRRVHEAMGRGKSAVPGESVTQRFAFASVVATVDINTGDILNRSNTWVMRPGGGDFTAGELEQVRGCRAKEFIPAMTQISRSDIDICNIRSEQTREENG